MSVLFANTKSLNMRLVLTVFQSTLNSFIKTTVCDVLEEHVTADVIFYLASIVNLSFRLNGFDQPGN